MSKKNSIKKKKIHEDCWDLDLAFLKWLRERLPVYLKDASKIADLSFHKFEHLGKTYTQEELIKRMIYLLDCSYTIYTEEDVNNLKEVLEIWKLVFFTMWW